MPALIHEADRSCRLDLNQFAAIKRNLFVLQCTRQSPAQAVGINATAAMRLAVRCDRRPRCAAAWRYL